MRKFNWFKLSQVDTGSKAMGQKELEEAYGDKIPQEGKLGGFYYTIQYNTQLALPTIIDTNKTLINVLKNKKTPQEVAATAYTEAFGASQKALDIAKKLNTTDPQEVQKYLYKNLISGIAYNPADPYAQEHELRHKQGGRMSRETLEKELAAGLPGDIPQEERMIIAKYFVDNWINNVMRLYSREKWEEEFYAMFPQMKDILNNKQLQIIRNNILSQMPKEKN